MATKSKTPTTTQTTNNKTSTKETTGSKKEQTLDGLFEDALKDILSAEKQLVEALPKMAKAADNEDLEVAFTHHLEQTKKHVERIEKIMDKLDIDKEEENECEAMKGLIEEGEQIISDFKPGPVRDAALIMAAQKVEHYEIAAYGSLREFADVLGLRKECDLLNRTLQEEGDTDHNLSELAMQINDEAMEHAGSEKEEANW
jgi:ferritin-like metal-binding protein YciE